MLFYFFNIVTLSVYLFIRIKIIIIIINSIFHMNVCSLNSNRLDFSNKINCEISKNILLTIVKIYFLIKSTV